MALPIERWARQAHVFDPVPDRLFDDLDYLARYQRESWPRMRAQLLENGVPTAVGGPFGGLEANAPQADVAALTGVTVETALFAAATYTPIALGIQAPKSFKLSMSGLYTTGATATPTWTWTPRVGTTTSGTTMGASGACGLVVSLTNIPWQLIGDFQIRGSGASGTAVGMFQLSWSISATITDANAKTVCFGGTTASAVDFTAAQGITLGVTPSNTTISVTPKLIHWLSWN